MHIMTLLSNSRLPVSTSNTIETVVVCTAFFQVLAKPVQKADANDYQSGLGHVCMRVTLLI